MAAIQSNKVRSIKIFKSSMFRSLPSKVLAFISLHKHHNTECGIASRIIRFLCLPNLPFQHAKTSTTLLGITHCIPNKLKTRVHKGKDGLQFPIMSCMIEFDLLMKGIIAELHMGSHGSFFITGNTEQIWEDNLQRRVPTPSVMPKTCSSTIAHFEYDEPCELIPPTTNFLP